MLKIPKDKLFAQVRYEDLLSKSKLWLITLFKINCEIYIRPRLMSSPLRDRDLDRIKTAFDRNKILRRVHAPLYDPYKEGFGIFMESYSKSSEFCKRSGARTIIMHVEYESKRYPSLEGWLRENIPVWKWIADSARVDGMRVLLENHHESSAEPIVRILTNAGNIENIKACFDAGHFNAFGEKGLISYLDDYTEDSIEEIHLSDNLGDGDAHLPLGKGNIDFLKFFDAVEAKDIDPVYTVEAKDIWGLIGGMSYLRRLGKL